MLTLKDIIGSKNNYPSPAVGLEVEAEFNGMGDDVIPRAPKGWDKIADGSLRGASAEYISRGPVLVQDMRAHIKALTDVLQNSRIKKSNNTSLHVHVNVQFMTPVQVWTSIIYAWMMDDLIMNICAKHRKESRFCLTASKGNGMINTASKILDKKDPFFNCSRNTMKYSNTAIHNIRPLQSIEFRGKEGIFSEQDMYEWADLCQSIVYCPMAKWPDPAVMMDDLIKNSDPAYLMTVLPRVYMDKILANTKDLYDIVNHNIIALSQLAYQVDWPKYAEYIDATYKPLLGITSTTTTIFNVDAMPRYVVDDDIGMPEPDYDD